MSLCSLKKSTQSAKQAAPVSIDSFIDDALTYAAGKPTAARLYALPEAAPVVTPLPAGPMRRATFTLTEDAINKLGELSATTGICRSRLIRIWIEKQTGESLSCLLADKTP